MKIKTLLLTLAFAVSSVFALAGEGPKKKPAAMFELDEAAAYEAVGELSNIEKLAKDSDATLSELDINAEGLVTNVQLDSLTNVAEAPLGIPSIVWGFCFGLLGMVFVYLMTDGDRQEVMSSFYGCLAAVVISVVLQLALGLFTF